jgi:hypothetical protein
MSNFFKDLKLVGKASQTIETLSQNYKELQTRFEAANDALQKTKSHLNLSDQLKEQIQKKLDKLKSELFCLKSVQSETQEENELLLLQLHQKQVEIEHQFLELQETKRHAATSQTLLNKVLANNPKYFSYKEIQCHPAHGQTNRLHWSIKDFFCASGFWPSYKFETIVEKEMVGFVFSKEKDGTSPLTVWPKSCENLRDITCIPTGSPDNIEQRAEIIKTMSTSDWQLVTLLPDVLAGAINKGDATTPNGSQLINGLRKTKDILLNHIPPKLRFDKVELTNILVHPEYEHLSFNLDNLSFGDAIYPEFEFRLGCSNVTKYQFGTNPKLEFPLAAGKTQLESWYVESEDEFGPKLEIRFALPDAMDLNVWKKLKIKDQKLVSSLIHSLAGIIGSLKSHFNSDNRSHTEWIEMVGNLQKIFALRTLDK